MLRRLAELTLGGVLAASATTSRVPVGPAVVGVLPRKAGKRLRLGAVSARCA